MSTTLVNVKKIKNSVKNKNIKEFQRKISLDLNNKKAGYNE